MLIKSSYLKRFFASYALILLPSFLIFTLFASGFFTMLRNRVNSSLELEVSHFTSKFELQFQTYQLLSLRLGLDPDMASSKWDYTRFSSLTGIKKLQGIKLYDQMIFDVFLSLDQENIFSTNGMSSIDAYFNRYLHVSAADQETFVSEGLFDLRSNGISLLRTSYGGGFLVFHYPVSLEKSYNFASINFVVDLSMAKTLLDDLSRGYDSYVGLILADGETIVFQEAAASVSPAAITRQPGSDTAGGDQGFTLLLPASFSQLLAGLTRYSTLTVPSELTGVTFALATRDSLMYRQIIQLQLGIYIFLALLLMAALAVSYRFSKRNSEPIQQLAQVFSTDHPNELPAGTARDEISFIQQMMAITIEENKKMSRTMHASRSVLAQQTMLLLFTGVLNDQDVAAKMLEVSELGLEESHFCVLLIALPQTANVNAERIEQDYEQLRQLPDGDLSCVMTIAGQKVLALLLGVPNQDPSKIFRRDFCRRLSAAGSEKGIEPYLVCSSRVYDDLEQINQAYYESVYVFRSNQPRLHPEPLIFFDDVLTFDLPIVTLSKSEIVAFQNAVQSLDRARIATRFSYLMQQLDKEKDAARKGLSFRFAILNLVLHSVMELGLDQEILPDILNIDPSNAEDFKIRMTRLFDRICQEKGPSADNAFQKVLKYIHDNYMDVNLSLEGVAVQAGLSKAYLSRLFRLKTGKKYIDYLTDIRMKETMRLLTETRLSIKDVTQKVGYFDIASFQKKFKLLYGLSPAKYRELYGKPENHE